MNPKEVGEKSEGQVLAALLKKGKVVLLPFGDNQRYDLAIDENGRFIRVQCKTGRLKEGYLYFDSCSKSIRTEIRKDYRGQADFFGVYSPDLDQVFLVPVEDVPITGATLRIDPPKNGQKKGIRMADLYKL